MQDEAARVLGPWTPSAFRALGVDRSILVLETLLGFVPRLVGDTSTSLAATRAAHDALKTARDSANRQAGEALSAMQALDHARDQARRLYISARRVFGVVLTLDGKEDSLNRYMEPLFTSSSNADAPTPEMPAEPPTTGSDPTP